MCKLKTLINLITVVSVAAALFACAKSNDSTSSAVVLDSSGKHAANWVTQHWQVYNSGAAKTVAKGVASVPASSQSSCTQCHGSDLSGGISGVGCFTATFNGTYCHDNGDRTLGHPTSWGDPVSSNFHGSVNSKYNGASVKGNPGLAGTGSCGLCHSTTNPNAMIVGTVPSCLSTSQALKCHTSITAGNTAGCLSCHGSVATAATANAGQPAGDAWPNRQGTHDTHLALAGVDCDTCHNNYGTGTASHATTKQALASSDPHPFVNPITDYYAETGIFNYANGTCAATSCHGGQTTPAWYGGTIPVDTANANVFCQSCHAGATAALQFNSYVSGNNTSNATNLHEYHLVNLKAAGRPVVCTDCHTLTTAQHFGGLKSHTFDTPPGDTVTSAKITSYDKTATNCTTGSAGSCHFSNPRKWNK